MAAWSLEDVASKMRDIDFTMLTTKTENGQLASRPMSNNGDVEFDGDSYFFSYDSSRTVSDIARDPSVTMSLQGSAGLLGKPPVFLSIAGRAEIIRDKAVFAAHWMDDLKRWFKQGIDTPGMVMIKVSAERIHYWDGEEDGEITL